MKKSELKLDKETSNLLTEQKKLRDLVSHEGWSIVRKKILEKASELLNLDTLDVLSNPQSAIQEIGMRKLAAYRLLEVLKDITGTVEQFDANSALTQQIEQSYIIRPSLKK